MQRRVSKVPRSARPAGMSRSSVARLWGNPERRNEAAKLPSTSRLPRSSDRRRRLKTAKDESGRVKWGAPSAYSMRLLLVAGDWRQGWLLRCSGRRGRGGRRHVPDRRGRDFDGSVVVAVEVVHGDAEEVLALGGGADLYVAEDAVGGHPFDLIEATGDVDGIAHGVHRDAVGVKHKDDEFEVRMDGSVGHAQEGEVFGVDQIVDAVAPVGAVGLRGGHGG